MVSRLCGCFKPWNIALQPIAAAASSVVIAKADKTFLSKAGRQLVVRVLHAMICNKRMTRSESYLARSCPHTEALEERKHEDGEFLL